LLEIVDPLLDDALSRLTSVVTTDSTGIVDVIEPSVTALADVSRRTASLTALFSTVVPITAASPNVVLLTVVLPNVVLSTGAPATAASATVASFVTFNEDDSNEVVPPASAPRSSKLPKSAPNVEKSVPPV
ncbi:unnamed protein product, partial [Rotaria sp. Silwood1]